MDCNFKTNADKLTQYYVNRGYPIKQLRAHYKRVSKFTQVDLLTDKPKNKTPPVMITRYNPTNPNIKKFIYSNWNIIENCDELKQIVTQKPLIGFRRLPNLRDIPTSNRISYPPIQNPTPISQPKVCTRLGKCNYCPLLYQIEHFQSHHTGKTHKCMNLPKPVLQTCEVSNIVYLIECTLCGKQYIGETGRPFRNRIYEHIASVKKHKSQITPVSKHFHLDNHSHKHMRFGVIEWLGAKINPDTQTRHRANELKFIWDVPTITPIGTNQFV